MAKEVCRNFAVARRSASRRSICDGNAPQIVMLGDGRLRMYLATIIPGETGPDGGLKHYMVAATGVIQ